MVTSMIYAPFPGEFIASALRRGKEILGIRCRQSDYQITKVSPRSSKDRWQIVLPPVFQDDDIAKLALYENTLYPLFSVMGRTVYYGNYTPNRNWRICFHCVEEDSETYGSPFIHVAHLTRSVTLCYKHAVRLAEKCPSCGAYIHSHDLASIIDCSVYFPDVSNAAGSQHHDYAIFVNSLLDFRDSTYSQPWVNSTLSDKYIQVLHSGDHFTGYTSYRQEIGQFLGMHFNETMSDYLSLDFCLALAFLGFRDAESLMSILKRPSEGPREPVIRAHPR